MVRVAASGARGGDRTAVHRGFGLVFSCDFELCGLPGVEARAPDVRIMLSDRTDVEQAWSGSSSTPAVVEATLDGLAYRMERGAAGDHRFDYGDRAAFHLSGDARDLRCAPSDVGSVAWRRVLLDSVLAATSLLHGHEALHAAGVLVPDGAIALIAGTGGGKSTLAAELLRRGLPLLCDDVLALSRDSGRVLAHPAPPVMNLPAGEKPPRGSPLAELGHETWWAVDDVAHDAVPLVAVFLIARRPALATRVAPVPASPLRLLAHALASGSRPERRRARFELLADVAAHVPAYAVEADPEVTPGHLADLVESALRGLRPTAAESAR